MNSSIKQIGDENRNEYSIDDEDEAKLDYSIFERDDESNNGASSPASENLIKSESKSSEECGFLFDGCCDVDVNDVNNYISLELFSVIFDKIHINKGILESIWYVEIEKDGNIFWSNVIVCNFEENNNGFNNGLLCLIKSLSSGRIRNSEEVTSITITGKELSNLLIKDGVVGKEELSLFTSVGFWKSLFLALNYSAYLMKKREILYSKEVNEYISKFNQRKEVIERRKKNFVNEEERVKSIGSIYGKIRSLFAGITKDESNSDIVDTSCNKKGNDVRVSYKTPFFWASSVGLIYILEKIGKLDYMLFVIEYISEVIPEVIFEFDNISDDPIVKSLNNLNNELLKNVSMSYQEYLSDLLSISKRSVVIMNSYLKNDLQERGVVRSSGKEEKKLNITTKEPVPVKDEELISTTEVKIKNGNVNLSSGEKKKPNYMKPTKLSEMRRQNIKNSLEREKQLESKCSVDSFVKDKEKMPLNGDTNILVDLKDEIKLESTPDKINDNLSEGDEENSNNINSNKRLNVTSIQTVNLTEGNAKYNTSAKKKLYKDIANKSVDVGVSLDERVRKPALSKEINVKSVSLENIDKSFQNNSVLSKIQIEKNISDFDNELINIISEIDKIKVDGVNIIKEIVSTNASEEGNSHQILAFSENLNVCNDEENSKLNVCNIEVVNNNNNNDIVKVEEEVKSPMDPYDWYYTSNTNEVENNYCEIIQLKNDTNFGVDNASKSIQEYRENKHYFDLKYIESILDKEIEELQKKENELANNLI
ncbi:hypothetical protein FG386_000955 [Cryptosporidium ryanae]|uniref:uncharacterized protein n=1 Tax=Cryptosporidium ryanae TaxID=515981 RepID=UPI003519EE17|nr:hypothetical protein FG386_000955 [Cryptosporidium ryanae]